MIKKESQNFFLGGMEKDEVPAKGKSHTHTQETIDQRSSLSVHNSLLVSEWKKKMATPSIQKGRSIRMPDK